MKNFRVSRVALVILTLALFGGVGCGNKDNPLPPPPPQIPNGPSYGGGYGGFGGSCGGVPGGTPFNQMNMPYVGILNGGYSYGGQSQITLNLAYAQGFSGSYQSNYVVGSAQLTLPDITQTPLCVSSTDPTTGQLMYGQSYGGQISLAMAGVAQLPNPYFTSGYGYGGQQQFIQAPVYANVDGYLFDNQVTGYVTVTIGGQQFQYQAGYYY